MEQRSSPGAPGWSRRDPADVRFMRRALALARRGLGLVSPNPMVGAVVVRDGRVVGEGWHRGPGTPHAEVEALAAAGPLARGATLYVTLEPCSHHGRTPPCAPAVIGAGVAEVVVGTRDPNPLVDGRGLALLREAGVAVREGVLSGEAERLIEGFAKHVRTGLPFVTLKLAASLDGRAAARDGSSRWITGAAARRDAHRLRAESGAVVVGAGTALADAPSLTVRLREYRGRQPLRVVLDSRGRVPASGPLFEPVAPTLVATTPAAPDAVRRAWEEAGAEVAVLEPDRGRVPLPGLLELLGKRAVQGVLIEGGPTVAWSAVAGRLVDRLVLYLGARLIGGREAPGALAGDGVPTIARAMPVAVTRVRRVGEDLRVEAVLGPMEGGEGVHGDR
jgi:diaminohydroxyphosphoribosylaminopyrimidine deaminase/5-amino-6-(5-phosphoribosylamino)uracil reductase